MSLRRSVIPGKVSVKGTRSNERLRVIRGPEVRSGAKTALESLVLASQARAGSRPAQGTASLFSTYSPP